jgi:hypothetical protein
LSTEQRELDELTEITNTLGRHTAQFMAEKVFMVEKRRQASAMNAPVKQKDFQLIRNTNTQEANGMMNVITGESIRDRDLKGKTTTFNKGQFGQINTIERMHRFLESQFAKEKSKKHIKDMPNGANCIVAVKERLAQPGSRGKPPPPVKYTPCKCNCPHNHSHINAKTQNVYNVNDNGINSIKGPMDNPTPGPVEIFREKQYLSFS